MSRGWAACLLWLTFNAAEAKAPKDFNWLIQAAGDYHYATSSGAVEKGLNATIVAGGGVGAIFLETLYLGAKYDYWISSTTDRLNLQSIGLELGYTWGNPRVFWIIGGEIAYPFRAEAVSGGTTFSQDTPSVIFVGKVTMGLRLDSYVSLLFHGGYREAKLGELVSGSSSYVSGGFTLSGLFGGAGLALTL